MSEPEKRKGRRSQKLDFNTLGGRIRFERERRGLSTELLGSYIGVTNQQISFAEKSLAKVPTGTYMVGEKEKKGYSDQLVFALAHELGKDFDEPEIRHHLDEWLDRMGQLWFGGDAPGDSMPSMPPPTPGSQPSAALIVGGDVNVGKVAEEDSEDFNALLNETREQRKERRASKKPSKKSGWKK
ncbi:MAG TPA: helix-turn-helix transcriptional regulator [Pyrinomonadaceae bacterium]